MSTLPLQVPGEAAPLPWVCADDVTCDPADAIQTLDKEAADAKASTCVERYVYVSLDCQGCLLIRSAVSAPACQRLAEFAPGLRGQGFGVNWVPGL